MKRKIGKLLLGILLLAGGCVQASAQEYTGITGMMHVPTAEMAPTGTARIGAFFLNGEFTPTKLAYKGDKYNTFNHFLAIAPFSWVELSYVCTLLKTAKNLDESQGVGFYEKDRHFCVKIRPLKEGKYWPALAIGAQDPTRTIEDKSGDYAYFCNFYVAASKHLDIWGHELGVHLTYRYYRSDFNAKWRGVAGGITYRPAFAPNSRAMLEYTGDDVNVAVDCYLWRLLFLQAGLQNGKYFSGGLMLRIQL